MNTLVGNNNAAARLKTINNEFLFIYCEGDKDWQILLLVSHSFHTATTEIIFDLYQCSQTGYKYKLLLQCNLTLAAS